MVTLFAISISPAMAASTDALADSQYPKSMNDNQNTGQSQYVGPQNNNTKWNYTTGDANSTIGYAPSIGPDGTIYVPTRFNNGSNYMANLYALNPDGSKKWNYTIVDGLNSGGYNSFRGSPAITKDGTIYINGEFHDNTRTYGFVYALNPDGTFKWKYILNEGATVYMSGSLAVGTNGTIYFTSQFLTDNYLRWKGKLNALNPNGTKKWEYIVNDGIDGVSRYSPAIAPDGTIYFVYSTWNNYNSCNLYAMYPNGTKKWNFLINNENSVSHPSVASDGTIYLTTRKNLYAINPDGSFKWKYTPNINNCNLQTSPSIAKDGTIYVAGSYNDGNSYLGILYAINPDGTLKWSFITTQVVMNGAAIGADGTIYFGDGGVADTFYALNPDGTVKWSLAVQPTTAAALDRNGNLYFGILKGRVSMLYAIQGPLSNPNNNNPNNNPQVNAATTTTISGNTIEMQNTGIPIAGIVLALMMVIGGFIGTRKKQ